MLSRSLGSFYNSGRLVFNPKRFLSLHEYQAAELLSRYHMPVLRGKPAHTLSEAESAAQYIEQHGGSGIVVKAQVHAGGRGKGRFAESGLQGGVQIVDKAQQVSTLAPQMLGNTLVTKQSGAAGKPCNTLYLVQKVAIQRELYISITLDRAAARPVIICSPYGGMGIEEQDPSNIFSFPIDPKVGLDNELVNKIVQSFKLTPGQAGEAEKVVRGIYKCFVENDAQLIEINPLAAIDDQTILVCDSKVNVDDNSLFRHKELHSWDDVSQKDPKEVDAERFDLNYISLDGNIGCMVNGAGLAMATMDYVKLHGGSPANFLDVGGGVTVDRVAEAMRILNSDTNVSSILVNIFGGIARCDIIVEGLIKAVRKESIKKPIVLRLKGTNEDIAERLIQESGLKLFWAKNLEEATKNAVKLSSA